MAMEGAGRVFHCSEFSAGRQPVPRELKSTECNGEIVPCFMMEEGHSIKERHSMEKMHSMEKAHSIEEKHSMEKAIFMAEKRPRIL